MNPISLTEKLLYEADVERALGWSNFLAGSKTVHKRLDVPKMSEETARFVWGAWDSA